MNPDKTVQRRQVDETVQMGLPGQRRQMDDE